MGVCGIGRGGPIISSGVNVFRANYEGETIRMDNLPEEGVYNLFHEDKKILSNLDRDAMIERLDDLTGRNDGKFSQNTVYTVEKAGST